MKSKYKNGKLKSMPVKPYVINLDRNPERLQAFTARFDALGIPFERFPGVDGKAMSEKDFAQFVSTRPRNGKPWGRGALGCFLSHYTLWQKIAVSDQEYSAVFEDDIHHVSNCVKDYLQTSCWLPRDCDILRLEPSTNRLLLSKEPVATWRERGLFKVRSTSWCAGAYIISREAAKRLAALPHEHHNTADHTLFSYEDSIIAAKLNTLQVVPAICLQDKFYHRNAKDVAFKSDISTADEGRSFKARLHYALKKSPLTWLRRSLQGYKRIGFAQ
jgi:glycosyl transferase, family 25